MNIERLTIVNLDGVVLFRLVGPAPRIDEILDFVGKRYKVISVEYKYNVEYGIDRLEAIFVTVENSSL